MLLTSTVVPHDHGKPGICHWLAWLLAVSSAVLVPWAAYLAATLPPSVSARHWPVVWTGLDCAMAVGLGLTAWLAVRGDRRLAFAATATATLLLADAWFDVCTTPAGGPLTSAIGELCVEIAEAAACAALAFAAWRRDERRMVLPDAPVGASSGRGAERPCSRSAQVRERSRLAGFRTCGAAAGLLRATTGMLHVRHGKQ